MAVRLDLTGAFAAMIRRLTESYYGRATRRAASGFVKARLEQMG